VLGILWDVCLDNTFFHAPCSLCTGHSTDMISLSLLEWFCYMYRTISLVAIHPLVAIIPLAVIIYLSAINPLADNPNTHMYPSTQQKKKRLYIYHESNIHERRNNRSAAAVSLDINTSGSGIP
jgi:hypothetical protein